tara:strand:- start:2128 stop:2559 length:432 start_codon:yes stop_codon:yes gene_type:complete
MSGLIERSRYQEFHEAGYLDLTISEFVLKLKECRDPHFFPQTYRLPEDFVFDYIINLNNIDFVRKIIGLENSFGKAGDHNSQYSDNDEDYKFQPIRTCFNQAERFYNKNINNYFTSNDLEVIDKYYQKDFRLLKSVNINHELS